jgi:hypothetical protein
VLAPLVLASSGWGAVWSVDARHSERIEGVRPERCWQLAWLAVIVAFALATAGIVKAYTGWLDPSTSAAYGHAMLSRLLSARVTAVGTFMFAHAPQWMWGAMDVATVAEELGGVVAVWSLRWFRRWLAALAAFHLAVGLQMDIWFASNLVVYSAFVPWGRLVAPLAARRVGLLAAVALAVVLVAVSVVDAVSPPTGSAVTRWASIAVVAFALPAAGLAWSKRQH